MPHIRTLKKTYGYSTPPHKIGDAVGFFCEVQAETSEMPLTVTFSCDNMSPGQSAPQTIPDAEYKAEGMKVSWTGAKAMSNKLTIKVVVKPVSGASADHEFIMNVN
jgi:hypothetical protein